MTTPNPLLSAALAYSKRGWLVFPCMPRSKIPATPHGFKDATTDIALIEAWWEQNPNYNVAIATGEASGTYVLDVDDKEWRSLADALRPFPKIPDTPTVRTGGGGVQYFFAFPKGSALSISGGKLGDGIDTRGNGGYVVAPPSIHPSGRAYAWEEFEDEPLAPTPEWIVKALEKQRAPAHLSSAGEKLTGGRHATLMTAAALMRGLGMVPDEINAALQLMPRRMDLSDGRVITPKEIEDIAFWTKDKATGLVTIENVTHGEAVSAALLKSHGEAVAEILASQSGGPVSPGLFPTELLHVPGIIDDLTVYINDVGMYPQPNLALGAAICAFGAVLGRKVESINGARTNLYALGVCDSGGGKDNARQVIKRVFYEAGLDCFLGPEELASDAGLVRAVQGNPSLVFLLDEIGRLIKTMGDPKSAPHLYGIATSLMKLYSSAGSVWKGKAYADDKMNPVIDQPNACLYGTTVPESFYQSMTTENITDGFLSRLLVFTSDDHYPQRKARSPAKPPAVLTSELQAWHGFKPGGNLSGAHPRPMVVQRTPDAQRVFDGIDALVRKERKVVNRALGTLWTRVEQKADQLSLIHACSRSLTPKVDEEGAVWARDLAVYITRRMVWDASDRIAENQVEATSKRVLRIVREAGEEGLTKWELGQRTRFLSKRERSEVIDQLLEHREMCMETLHITTKPRTVYRCGTYAAEETKSVKSVNVYAALPPGNPGQPGLPEAG